MSFGSNIFEIMYNLFFKLVEVGSEIWNFLFQEITILDTTFSLFSLLFFGGIAVFIILYLVKQFVPVAQKGDYFMDFTTALYNIIAFIFDTITSPVLDFFYLMGFETFDFDAPINLSGIFGISQLPSFSTIELIALIVGFTVSITALMLVIKFIKFLNGLLKGLFTGIKR